MGGQAVESGRCLTSVMPNTRINMFTPFATGRVNVGSVNISCVDVGILTVKREVCGDQSNLVLTIILISAILLQRSGGPASRL